VYGKIINSVTGPGRGLLPSLGCVLDSVEVVVAVGNEISIEDLPSDDWSFKGISRLIAFECFNILPTKILFSPSPFVTRGLPLDAGSRSRAEEEKGRPHEKLPIFSFAGGKGKQVGKREYWEGR
jgi:hypothetical protein